MKREVRSGLLGLCCGLAVLLPLQAEGKKADIAAASSREAAVDSVRLAKKHLDYGRHYLRTRQYGDAKTQLLRSWNLNPRDGRAAYYMGRLYHETEAYDDAVLWFNRTTELAPGSKSARNAYHYLADIYTLREDRTGAIAAYEALLGFPLEREWEAQYLTDLVTLCVEEGAYEAALEHSRRLGELKPGDPLVQDTIAKLALHTGKQDEALEKMRGVLNANPEDYETLHKVADIHRQRGEHQEAFDAYERLSAHAPRNFLYLETLLDLGRKLDKPGDFRVGVLKKMLELQPENVGVIEQLADETGAIALIDRGIGLAPGNGRLTYLKGDYYFKRWEKTSAPGDSVLALTWFEKTKADPQWREVAQRMVDEINPPLTEAEKKRREFFKKEEKAVAVQEGKK